MKERERIVVSGLVVLMMLLWLGFVLHQSPRFAGSLTGGVLGIAAAVLMLVPLAYSGIKRIKSIRNAVKPKVSMRTLLAWHVYAGIIAPILALLHTGHRFESPLGIVLTSFMLTVVLSGFVGRYLMSQISREMRDKRDMLAEMESAYAQVSERLRASEARPRIAWTERLFAGLFSMESIAQPVGGAARFEAVRIAESMADLEYAIKTHELFKAWFTRWLKFHIAISAVFYILMGVHIASEIYYGLRWLN